MRTTEDRALAIASANVPVAAFTARQTDASRTTSAVTTTIASGDGEIEEVRDNSWLQEPHRFNRRHDPIEQQFRIKSDRKRREDQQTGAEFFRQRDWVLDARIVIPIRIRRDASFLQTHCAIRFAEEGFFSARRVNAATSTMPTPVIQTAIGYAFHAPMRIVISAAKPLKPGMPIDAAEAMTKANAANGIVRLKFMPRELVEIARVRAAIDHASGNGEEQGADDAVRKHLQHGAGNAEHIGRRQPEQHEAHVAHARIADDEFEIALPQRDRRGVNNSDDGENRDPFAPHLETERKEIHRHAQRAVGAKLHHDAGEQHRTGGRRGDVTGRRPGVQRPDAGENGEAEKQNRKRPGLQLRRELESARVVCRSSEPALT